MSVAILKFPGTNCDEDVFHALKHFGLRPCIVWYKEFKPKGWDAIVVPGGFSYGDWLRAGAIAARTPSVEGLAEAAEAGTPTLGICNGFQILVEAGLLPGALLPNEGGRFVCKWTKLSVERPRGPWLSLAQEGQGLDMPVAHAEGRYFVDEGVYRGVLLRAPLIRYLEGWNPNGSAYNVAGVASEDGTVLGLMPHPERAYDEVLVPRGFSAGGRVIFESLARSLRTGW